MARIGVEENLTHVEDALRERGYETVPLRNEDDFYGCDCCVVTGQDSNLMGIQNVSFEGSIIDASGMNAEEICREVDERVSNMNNRQG
ncbi:YkuS family protein [Rubeoparvulum massiliense]|uniref:YkuS family protein n=1 Tax=Rubeoparvulum massiliense TaxID=1631346 RepID=UPI00065E94A7|nr:YkuS family protein [Rubeoparvulum massiliense]